MNTVPRGPLQPLLSHQVGGGQSRSKQATEGCERRFSECVAVVRCEQEVQCEKVGGVQPAG